MTTLKEKLTERDYLPVLKMADGREVTRENWRERREEMLALLEKYSYGHTPKCPGKVWGETLEINEKCVPARCEMKRSGSHLRPSTG